MRVSQGIDGFENLIVETDTQIIFRHRMEVDGITCLHEKWSFDGLLGESLIFHASEVQGHADEDLESLVKGTGLYQPGSAITIKRDAEGYTFLNFNFRPT